MTAQDSYGYPNSVVTELEDAEYSRLVTAFPANLCIAAIYEGIVVRRWVSAGVADIFGYDIEELQNDSELCYNIVHPSDKDQIDIAFNRLLSGKSTMQEYRVFRRDGQLLYVRETCAPGKDSAGRVVRAISLLTDVTAERSIEDQPIQFKHLLDETPTAVAIRDLSGKLIYCNEACARMYGYSSAAEMIGTSFEDILPQDSIENFEIDIKQKLLEGSWSGEYRLKRKDNSLIDVHVSANLLRKPDGTPWAIYGILSDITEHKRAEQALRENEELLHVVQNSLMANIAVLDIEGNIIAVNESWERFARENGDPDLSHTGVGINYLDVCRRAQGPYSEGAKETLDGLRAILDGTKFEFELTYPCPSPHVDRWFIMRAAPLHGERRGLVVSHFDITARMQIQEALRESEKQLRSLTENLDAMIYRMSPDHRCITMIGKPENISGYTAEELINDPNLWPGGVYSEDIGRLSVQLDDAAITGTPVSVEFHINARWGELRWLRVHATPQYDERGNLAYFDCIGLDITERIEAQQRAARHTSRMAALADISQAFTSSLQFNEIIDIATERIIETLDCICAAIFIEPETGRLLQSRIACTENEIVSLIQSALEQTELSVANIFGSMGEVKPIIVSDIRDISPELASFANKTGVGPGILVPVYSGDELILIFAGLRQKGEPVFDDEDIWFLTEVASHASAALTKASIYRRQARIAETLQRSLIPAAQKIECMDVATFYSPASGEAEVGGDFFDIIHFGGKTAGIVVGDVSGKGMDAAIHTAEAKYMIRGFANQNPDPGYVITELNKALCIYTGEFSFVTLFYGLVSVGRKTMAYVNAGHESPIILCRDTHSIIELPANGPILGVIEDQNYTALHTTLDHSHILFCYTDGVVELPINGERFGYDRLYRAVAESPVDSSQSVLNHVVSVIQTFGHAERPDDQVILVVTPQ